MNASEAREPAPEPSRKRRDATVNRARLLAAARAGFGPGGGTAREVAAAAGVSVATLYRHFPTRADLLAAARADQAATCGATVDRAVAEPDPAEALRSYLRESMAAQAAAPGFVAEFRRVRARELEAPLRRARFRRDLGRLVDRARAAGVVRPDATVADLLLILAANGGVTATRAAERLAWSRRLADLALAGLGLDKTPDR